MCRNQESCPGFCQASLPPRRWRISSESSLARLASGWATNTSEGSGAPTSRRSKKAPTSEERRAANRRSSTRYCGRVLRMDATTALASSFGPQTRGNRRPPLGHVRALFGRAADRIGSVDPTLAAREEATPEPGVPLLHADSVRRSRFKRLMTENSRMRCRSGVNITRSTFAFPWLSTPRRTAPGA
jgi:hypothetical protein